MSKIKVLIADDHQLIRQGIMQLIELDEKISVIGEAKDGVECLGLLKKTKPDVLLLDINMPNKSGLEVLKSVKDKKKKLKILILTIHDETEYLLNAVEAGADGYILKESGFDELREAIHMVYKGEHYIQPKLIPAMNSCLAKRDTDKEKLERLSKRELDVLVYTSQGYFNKEIAIKLDISERTVKNHMSSIFKKIDVVDRTQAAVFAIRNNLVQI